MVKLFAFHQGQGFHSPDHSHTKRKDSLEGNLDRVLLAAELDFPKIVVPMLLQNSSKVNVECARK